MYHVHFLICLYVPKLKIKKKSAPRQVRHTPPGTCSHDFWNAIVIFCILDFASLDVPIPPSLGENRQMTE